MRPCKALAALSPETRAAELAPAVVSVMKLHQQYGAKRDQPQPHANDEQHGSNSPAGKVIVPAMEFTMKPSQRAGEGEEDQQKFSVGEHCGKDYGRQID